MASALVDENQPLLGGQEEDVAHRRADEVDALHGEIDFDPKGDVENPLEWPVAFKWSIVGLLALMAFTVYVPTPISPP